MSYSITLTNGSQLFTLSDGITDTDHTSLNLVGKNSVNYGETQNNNLIHILENFANTIAPLSPLIGQLWYDTDKNTLNVYRNTVWDSLPTISYSGTPPATVAKSNLWFDSSINQLKIYDGATFNTIGPEGISGFSKTRMASESLKDVIGLSHATIKCTINGTIIAVLSADDFDISYDSSIDGLPHVYSGLTLATGYTISGVTTNSLKSNSLLGSDSINYRSSSIASVKNSIVERDTTGGITANQITATKLYSTSGIISGNWSVEANVAPLTDMNINLGSPELRWATVYSNIVSTNQISTDNMSSNQASVGAATFTSLSDSSNNIITAIDKDVRLSSSSDNKLSTQKAIKSYIDAEIVSALSTMTSNNNLLQNQINNLFNVPAGTVLYYAGLAAPTGYLIANGAVVDRSTYYNLWLALGGTSSPYGQTLQTFTLPDLRAEFIRGLDNGRGIDANRTIGSNQSSQNLAHTHGYTLRNGGYNPWWQYSNAATVSGYETQQTASSGGTEARPRNVALLPIIKT